MLKIFNTLTKKKEQFKPISQNEIKLYVCGITVYDLCHLGHGRTFVIFDTITRYLQHCGYTVNYVRNITDIDDKIIQKANKNHEDIGQFTKRMIQEMHVDLDTLGISRPNYEPKVTDYIDTIIKFINLLIQKKHAYIAFNGDVIFSIKTAYNYGVLSNRTITKKNITDNINNCCTIKQNLEDFVLWKSSKPGEPYWTAPWSKGRPGWHIECSAMNYAILGNHCDIHGGGSDLIFPHHENEIAQSTSAYPTSYVKTWMHTGMLSLDNEKMSKSLGNVFTIRDTLKQYDPETIRYFLLSAHYRSLLQYNERNIKNARISLERLYLALRNINSYTQPTGGEYFVSKFTEKMNDDFNIPGAYAVLFEMAHELNILKIKHNPLAQGIAATLKYLANILGILNQNPETYLKQKPSQNNKINFNDETIEELIQIREHARKNNQWDRADKIRKQLITTGIILEDEPTGKTKWRFYI